MKIPLPVLFAIGTALCWGLYGPTIGQARSPMHSPFKPYVGIGVAYLVWAVLGGLLVMKINNDSFSFTSPDGLKAAGWGFAAGTLGAWGALNLTSAMFSGGAAMPQVVMPIVFGGAVTINAVASVVMTHGKAKPSPMLWVGIVGMAICIVIVAGNTPHGHPKKKSGEATATQPAVEESSAAEH